MKHGELFVMVTAAAAVVGVGVWALRVLAGGQDNSSSTRTTLSVTAPSRSELAPQGFGWDVKRNAYIRVNAQGDVEQYAAGAYL